MAHEAGSGRTGGPLAVEILQHAEMHEVEAVADFPEENGDRIDEDPRAEVVQREAEQQERRAIGRHDGKGRWKQRGHFSEEGAAAHHETGEAGETDPAVGPVAAVPLHEIKQDAATEHG